MDTQPIEELVDLTGKVAVITGGAAGIGQAIAMAFAQASAGVMIADSNPDAAQDTVAMIGARGGYAEAILADACSAEDARRVFEATEERFGALDILVNAAATFTFSPALPRIDELWSRVLSVHVKGVFYYCDAAAKKMAKAGYGGRIVNVASLDAMRVPDHPVSNDVTESSVAIVSKALAIKYGPYGITVNALAPGQVRARSAQVQLAGLSGSAIRMPEDLPGTPPPLAGEHPVGGVDEILTAVLFLVSDAAENVTGNLVVVE